MLSHSSPPPTNRIVVGIAGRIGAGKTSAASYLSSKYSFQYLRYSQVIAEWFAGDPRDKSQLQEIGWEVMAGGMQIELNRRLIAQISPEGDFAVDGLRHPVDRQSLADSFACSFHLVYIECPSEIRWEHLKGRGKYTNFASFQTRDSHPVEQQIETLPTSADRLLKNVGSLEDLHSELDETIREFRKGVRR